MATIEFHWVPTGNKRKNKQGSEEWLLRCRCGFMTWRPVPAIFSAASFNGECLTCALRRKHEPLNAIEILKLTEGRVLPLAGVTFKKVSKRLERQVTCLCRCGNTFTLAAIKLKNRGSLGCGECRDRGRRSIKSKNRDHVYCKKLRSVWRGMLARCDYPYSTSFKNYGARGILVCAEWRDFDTFFSWAIKDFSLGLTLERVNVNGNYEPTNCAWIPQKLQSQNRRDNVRVMTPQGVLCLSQACRRFSITRFKAQRKIKTGEWTRLFLY